MSYKRKRNREAKPQEVPVAHRQDVAAAGPASAALQPQTSTVRHR